MDDAGDRGPVRHADGRFGPGNRGKPRGARGRMSRRVALSLLAYFENNEAMILDRMIGHHHLNGYMGLLGRLLPQGAENDGPDLAALEPQEAARITDAVRTALVRIEAGKGSLADIEAALAGMEPGADAP
jgi:hypothetical protein